MLEEKSVLPADFDGIFRFTNFTDKEFKAKWNSVEYTFPPLKTTPMIIPNATPEEVQHIRKKFAKELAVSCFYESDKFKFMNDKERGQVPALYTDSDIAPFIQRCLEPLPIAQAISKVLPKDDKKNYKATRVLDKDESLKGNQGEQVEL
jgi:hypothetical protein